MATLSPAGESPSACSTAPIDRSRICRRSSPPGDLLGHRVGEEPLVFGGLLDLVVLHPLPLADAEVGQPGVAGDLAVERAGDDLGGLDGPQHGRADDLADLQAAQRFHDRLRLPDAVGVQANITLTEHLPIAVPVGHAVPDQEDLGLQGRRP
jgi:hypothetical protein